MIRVIAQIVLPLITPIALYVAWAWYSHKKGEKTIGESFEKGPWVWLLAMGVALMLVGLLVFRQVGSGHPGETYIPPHVEDGKVVPGHFE